MSKASYVENTPTPNRRSILAGAGGIAAAGALSVAALAASAGTPIFNPSPELLEYRRCKAAWNACFVGDRAEDEAWEAAVAKTSGAVEEAIEIFLERAKAPRSWDDVKEIAEVQFTELFDIEDGELHQHSDHDEIGTMLLRAALAMGGKRIEAKPEPEVPAGSVVKLSNRPYSAERPGYWSDYDIFFAGHLVGHFRDTGKAAKYFDVPEAVVLGAGYGPTISRPPGTQRSMRSLRKRVRQLPRTSLA